MKNTNVLAAKMAGVGALALLLATSAFAENRPQDRTRRGGNQGGHHESARAGRQDTGRGGNRAGSYNNRGGSYDRGRVSTHQYRENQRVNVQGHISRFTRERGGYRVWLDNGPYGFWVPEARWRNDWRVGFGISLGGIFRNGVIYSDIYDAPYYGGSYRDGYRDSYVTGFIDRVDYRTGLTWLRDDRSSRLIAVDMSSIGRYSRLDARDLRRGDRVTVTGTWLRSGYFAADRLDAINSGRY